MKWKEMLWKILWSIKIMRNLFNELVSWNFPFSRQILIVYEFKWMNIRTLTHNIEIELVEITVIEWLIATFYQTGWILGLNELWSNDFTNNYFMFWSCKEREKKRATNKQTGKLNWCSLDDKSRFVHIYSNVCKRRWRRNSWDLTGKCSSMIILLSNWLMNCNERQHIRINCNSCIIHCSASVSFGDRKTQPNGYHFREITFAKHSHSFEIKQSSNVNQWIIYRSKYSLDICCLRLILK